ncbi:hypothetical protein IFM89_017891 [Coptis chinensis]|uniref:GDSL esterase/lipase n=1 Tax=Coptis chinensis TaxID=261450 RepID=A0A835I3Z4_9MAGN|nr:hypothetical protein IFM89_017891 [Coptis chinensis]
MIHQTLPCLLVMNMFSMFYGNVVAKVPAVIVFGDSTVDAGNNNYIPTLVKSNFEPYGRDFEGGKPTGRFCNGRLVTDFVSEAFGIKPFIPAYLDPAYGIEDFATGVSFASAGSGYDNLTSHSVSVIPMWKELDYFKNYRKRLISLMGMNKARQMLHEALYMISIGTNDFILNYYTQPAGRSTQYTIEEYENFLIGIAESFVKEIYQLGARKVSLVGLPPIGCLPLLRTLNYRGGGACREDCNNLARDFDGKVKKLGGKLSNELKGVKLLFTDVFNPALQVIENPHAYGFESVAIACCGTGTVELSYLCNGNNPFTCKDASKRADSSVTFISNITILTNMIHEILTCTILIQIFLLLLGQTRAKVPAVIVFGDSSVDAGNNDYIPTIGRSNFPPYGRDFYGGKATGRFCNGRLTTDFISEAFGNKPALPAYLDPTYTIKDFATGVTFASAGTGLDNVTSSLVSVIPFWKEVEYFKEYKMRLTKFMGMKKTNVLLHEAVYIFSIGTNDIIENYYAVPMRSSQFTIEKYEDFLLGLLGKFVLDMYKLGARKIALTGLTAFGCLPLERSTNIMEGNSCREQYNKVARDFNVKLNAMITMYNKELKGIKLVYSAVYDSLVDAIEKPYLYGFEKVAIGCCGTGKFETAFTCNVWTPATCSDASKFIFWDSIHYTEKMNRIVSDYAMKTAFSVFL